LSDELKQEIISLLNSLSVSQVAIRYEHSAETKEFVQVIARFLESNGFKVYQNGVIHSEIQRNEFTIQKHPSDPAFAKITIGPII